MYVCDSCGALFAYSYSLLAHTTLQHIRDTLVEQMTMENLMKVLAGATEFSEVNINTRLQSHFSRLTLPCSDYLADTKSVMDHAPIVLHAMMDVCA